MIGRHALHLTKEPYECPLTTRSTEPAGTGLRLGARHGGGPVNLVLVGLVRLIQSTLNTRSDMHVWFRKYRRRLWVELGHRSS